MLEHRSVHGKLLFVVLATTVSALLITGAALLAYDLHTFRERGVSELSAQADILALATAPALEFEDPPSAQEYLDLLSVRPGITRAAIYTPKGVLFATYAPGRDHVDAFPHLPEGDGYEIDGRELSLFKRIVMDNEIVGTVYLSAEYDLFARGRSYAGILIAVLVLSLGAAVVMSAQLQKTVTKPIANITEVARRVMEQRDFSLRAEKTTDDEIGVLCAAFNSMLSEIGNRTDVLEASNAQLRREVEERERAESARNLSQRRVRVLVSALTQFVWVADARGAFVDVADSWREYTGQALDEYRELGWRNAFSEPGRKTLEAAWAKALHDVEQFELELELWHAASGRYRFVRLRAVPMVDEHGAVEEWTGAVLDVDDQRSAEQNLRTLNAELEQRVAQRTAELESANRDLEGFSYSVSHDLRAPIRAIGGFTALLSRDHGAALDPEAQRKLAIIKSEADRMGALIDDLLAFSRLGRKALNPTDIDMRDLAEKTYARLMQSSTGPKIELRLGTLPHASGDRSLFEQVWINLLSNAIKFSSKKEVPVIEVGAISDEREHVYFVRDNGAGFDPRYKGNLFGVFQRLHSSEEFSGTGVGLALVHRIVTRHGGRVWADATLGEGATFHFTIPKEPAIGRV